MKTDCTMFHDSGGCYLFDLIHKNTYSVSCLFTTNNIPTHKYINLSISTDFDSINRIS